MENDSRKIDLFKKNVTKTEKWVYEHGIYEEFLKARPVKTPERETKRYKMDTNIGSKHEDSNNYGKR